MKLKHLDIGLDLKKEPDEDGQVEGYASVFDVVDNGMDVVSKGAFARSLQNPRRKVKMLWQHDVDKPIGVWDEIKEDEKGLFVKGRIFKDTSLGRDAIALLKGGAIDSLSIGYRTVRAMSEGANEAIRRLLEVDLYEVSFVTMPMLPEAAVGIKQITTIRSFESALRDAGFSQVEAKAIAADGFKGLMGHRDGVDHGFEPMPDLSGILSEMSSLERLFK